MHCILKRGIYRYNICKNSMFNCWYYCFTIGLFPWYFLQSDWLGSKRRLENRVKTLRSHLHKEEWSVKNLKKVSFEP